MSTVKRGPLTAMMDMPTTLQKRAISPPLTAEAITTVLEAIKCYCCYMSLIVSEPHTSELNDGGSRISLSFRMF